MYFEANGVCVYNKYVHEIYVYMKTLQTILRMNDVLMSFNIVQFSGDYLFHKWKLLEIPCRIFGPCSGKRANASSVTFFLWLVSIAVKIPRAFPKPWRHSPKLDLLVTQGAARYVQGHVVESRCHQCEFLNVYQCPGNCNRIYHGHG